MKTNFNLSHIRIYRRDKYLYVCMTAVYIYTICSHTHPLSCKRLLLYLRRRRRSFSPHIYLSHPLAHAHMLSSIQFERPTMLLLLYALHTHTCDSFWCEAHKYESNQKAKFQIQFTIMPFGARASKVLPPPPPPPFQIYTKHVNSHARFRLINLTLNIHWFMHCTHTRKWQRAQVRRTPGYWNKRIRWCSLGGGGANATKHIRSRCAIFTLIWINDILKHAYRLSSVFASHTRLRTFNSCTALNIGINVSKRRSMRTWNLFDTWRALFYVYNLYL